MTSLLGCGWGAHLDCLPLFGFSGEDDPDILEALVVDDVVNGDPVVLQELTGGFLLTGRVGVGEKVHHANWSSLRSFWWDLDACSFRSAVVVLGANSKPTFFGSTV